MKNNSPFVVSVTGWSGSGKTTFCEKLIAEMVNRGYKTAAAKKSQRTINPDREGSDSRRFMEAGAEGVCLASDGLTSVFRRQSMESDNQLPGFFPDADIIIAEGFKPDGSFRIEVADDIQTNKKNDSPLKNPSEGFRMLVYSSAKTLEVVSDDCATVNRNDISAAADIIVSNMS